MQRRTFLQRSALAALAIPLVGCGNDAEIEDTAAADSAAGPASDPRLARVGVTSVCFRSRFPATRSMGEPTTEPDLTLETFPAFVRDELGLSNVEIWDLHFDDTSIEYCERLRAAAADAGARIINVQVDRLGGDLSSTDPAERQRGIDNSTAWMDRCVALGAPSVRINTGGSEGETFDLETTAESFRQIAQHGQQIGVTVLVENHTGHSTNIDNVVAIVDAVNSPFCRTLLDFGNTPAGSTEDRIVGVQKLAPKLALVSAKGTGFNEQCEHVNYDFGALVAATEETGYRGIYSIEMYPDAVSQPPADPLCAARWMKDTILANLNA